LALPILLPPAAFVAVALGVFYLVEMLFFVTLKAGQVTKRAAKRPVKQVNVPRLDLRS
jgi:hypothetical protein